MGGHPFISPLMRDRSVRYQFYMKLEQHWTCHMKKYENKLNKLIPQCQFILCLRFWLILLIKRFIAFIRATYNWSPRLSVMKSHRVHIYDTIRETKTLNFYVIKPPAESMMFYFGVKVWNPSRTCSSGVVLLYPILYWRTIVTHSSPTPLIDKSSTKMGYWPSAACQLLLKQPNNNSKS